MEMSIYKRGIWLYLVLLIFEGALRKWFLPSLSTPLLLIREPIVIWLVLVGLNRGWLDSGYVKAIMVISTLSLLLSLIFGHGNIYVGLYGWRIYFFHIPFVFVMARLLNRDDVLLMGKFIIYVSIVMTAIIAMQFYSPQSSWINIGIGGEGSSGFSGALGYFRPSGTFSFTSGYVMFQSLIGSLLCYYLLMNDSLERLYRLPKYVLLCALAAYFISIPMSISRAHFFQTVILTLFMAVVAICKDKYRQHILRFSILGVIALVIVGVLGLMRNSMEAFTHRFTSANSIEGGLDSVIGGRYIGGLLSALVNFDIPFTGFGIGIATNGGAKIVNADMWSYFNGENEWSRIVGECGLLIGWSIIFIRVMLSLEIFRYAWRQMRRGLSNLLPWFLSASMLLAFPQGQMGVTTNLGFAIFITGLTFAALKIPSNTDLK